MSFIELHCHTDMDSNLRLIDTTNKVKETINYAVQLGLSGLAITGHESVSSHIKALTHIKKIHETNPDFQLILGNEIYLCHDTEPWVGEDGKTRYTIESQDFFHFILLAKDAKGHEQLRRLSSRAWERCYNYKRIDRVPTFYSDVEDIVGKDVGHLISSTACLGGEFPKLVLQGDVQGCTSFVEWCQKQFGAENFFVELQPGRNEEQIAFNTRAIKFCKHFGLKWIITNDVHYLSYDKRELHANFLRSKEEERELDDFYESTYFKGCDEMRERMQDYVAVEDIETGFQNTVAIGEMCKDAGDYGLFHNTIVPQRILKEKPIIKGVLASWYDTCPSIKYLSESPYEQDRFFLQECEKGLENKHIEVTKAVAERIDIEAQQLIGISEKLGCRLTSYYNLMQEIEDIIWDVSLIGTGRGSACCLYTGYLMDLHQIDSLKNELPYWRHTHVSKISLPDLDIDICPSKRPQVFELLKEHFGKDRCLNIITFKTETLKSAIKTAGRGVGLDSDLTQEMANLVPVTRGKVWSYKECLEGNDDNGHHPITELINLVQKYPCLHETIQEIEGLVTARGLHASGFYVMDSPYIEHNSLMKSPSGVDCTCWEMEDSDACGALKFDLLVTDAIQKIQKTVELLIEDGRMEWQGSWKATYNKYLHPDILNYTDEAMWNSVGRGEIVDLFQFMSDVGIQAINKIKPRSIDELATSSSIMRLMAGSDGIDPIDRYVAYRGNIELWYDEMQKHGLNEAEVDVMKEYLLRDFGCSVVQETLMLLSMDEHICGFDMSGADYCRKVIGKKLVEKLPQLKAKFYEGGEKCGTRKQMLDYVYQYGFMPQLGYAFNLPHVLAYATIALQEMNLFTFHPSIFWQTACLTINASSDEESDGGNTNYGKIAKAISTMQHQGVNIVLPEINTARFGFYPDVKNNRIVVGLRALCGVGDSAANQIITNRSYTSLSDFLTRNSNLGTTTIITLIKGGCFDELCSPTPRQEIMQRYLLWQAEQDNPPKEALNMQNFRAILSLGILPQEYDFQRRLNEFRSYTFSKEKMLADDTFLMDSVAMVYFDNVLCKFFDHRGDEFLYTNKTVFSYNDNGDPIIFKKPFEKFYKAQMEELASWVKLPSTTALFNEVAVKQAAHDIWDKYCQGTIPKWEMDSLSFYYTEHELAHVNTNEYSLSNFSDIPDTPVKIGENVRTSKDKTTGEKKQTTWDKYQLYRIAGTVLDKNKNKHSITLLTTDDVVNVKFYAGAFTNYDKQISTISAEDGKKTVLEKSWFTRGNKLLITGIRRGETFFPKRYYDSIYQHTVCKINQVYSNGSLEMQYERVGGNND